MEPHMLVSKGAHARFAVVPLTSSPILVKLLCVLFNGLPLLSVL